MQTLPIAADTPNAPSSDASFSAQAGTDALVELHRRTVDALKGCAKMVEKGESEFRTVAQEFHALHVRHSAILSGKLGATAVNTDPGGSLIGAISETVAGLRAFFDENNEDVLTSIRNGEGYVLEGFDDVLKFELPPGDAAAISAMRDELGAMLAELRRYD